MPAGVSFPEMLALKYGCGEKDYFACNSDLSITNDVQTVLRWDLKTMGLYTCVPKDATLAVKCQGPSDVTTCGTLGTPCEAPQRISVSPFKICYNAGEELRPGVDEQLWQRSFGQKPENKTCEVCFMMSVADKPFFIDFDSEWPDPREKGKKGIGTPFSGKEYKLAVGEEVRIQLLAAASNQGQKVTISVLGEPGAPSGSYMTPMVEFAYPKVTYNQAFLRDFVFVPLQGQQGKQYAVCFQGFDGNLMASPKKCFSIEVLAATIFWTQSAPCPNPTVSNGLNVCPPDGHLLKVTVNCKYEIMLVAKAERYSVQVRQQRLPTCKACGYGLTVEPCSSTSKGIPCCGNGLCDGAENGASCAEDCLPDLESITQEQTGSQENAWTTKVRYTWYPMHSNTHQGAEGRRLLRCFEGVTNNGEENKEEYSNKVVEMERTLESAPSFCIVIDVQRCSYCVSSNYATLKSLSTTFFLNMEWLRIYNRSHLVSNVCEWEWCVFWCFVLRGLTREEGRYLRACACLCPISTIQLFAALLPTPVPPPHAECRECLYVRCICLLIWYPLHSNPGILDPDGLIDSEVIKIGPSYVVNISLHFLPLPRSNRV